jgi:drug/metabolite transporter (DMT)-like permease
VFILSLFLLLFSLLSEPFCLFLCVASGFTLYIFGDLLHACALAWAPQSVVAPLNSVTLAANAVIAPFLLGDHLTRNDIIGTCLLLAGASLAIIFGDKSSTGSSFGSRFFQSWSLTFCFLFARYELGSSSCVVFQGFFFPCSSFCFSLHLMFLVFIDLFQPAFIVYAIILASFFALILGIILVFEKRLKTANAEAIPDPIEISFCSRVLGPCYSTETGILSSFNILFTKCM